MITREITVENFAEGQDLLEYIYDADKGSVVHREGADGTLSHVYGDVVTAQLKREDGRLCVRVHSNALSTDAGLNEYLPKAYHQYQ